MLVKAFHDSLLAPACHSGRRYQAFLEELLWIGFALDLVVLGQTKVHFSSRVPRDVPYRRFVKQQPRLSHPYRYYRDN